MKYKFLILLTVGVLIFSADVHARQYSLAGNALISGKLLQATGKPLAYTSIELVPVNSNKQIYNAGLLATSGAAGLFTFTNIPDGKYTLSINFDEKPSDTSPYETFFYPGTNNREEAEIFSVDAATKLNKINFQLPPKLAQRRIVGKVVNAEGKPVTDAYIILKDIEYDDWSLSFNNKTDKNGNFTTSGFENRKYVILVFLYDLPPSIYSLPTNPIATGKTDFFALSAVTASFNIVLKNTGIESDVY